MCEPKMSYPLPAGLVVECSLQVWARTHNCPTLSYLPAQDTFCPTDPLCPIQDTLILLSSRILKKFGFQIFKYMLQMSTSMTAKFAAE